MVRALLALALAGFFQLAAAAAPPLNPDAEAEQAYEQGVAAIKARQWAQAELLLERALMLNPEHAAARLELAGLLAMRGRADSARGLIMSLIADPRTPEIYRERLRAMLAQSDHPPAADQPEAAAEVWGEAFLAWAHNPLARASLRQLTLTFPEGPVTLPLAQAAEPGWVAGLTLRRTVPGVWTFDVAAQRLTADPVGGYRVGASGVLPWVKPGDETQMRWLAHTQQAYDGTNRHGAGVSVIRGDWALAVGGFTEPTLDRQGAYLRVEKVFQPRLDTFAVIFGAAEFTRDSPPGFALVGFSAAWAPAPEWALLLQGATSRDFSGYSPLLENDARRSMLSLSAAVERVWQPEAAGWQVVARAQAGRRWSNLELFGFTDYGVQLSLRQHWK